jgi:hypothetical protein
MPVVRARMSSFTSATATGQRVCLAPIIASDNLLSPDAGWPRLGEAAIARRRRHGRLRPPAMTYLGAEGRHRVDVTTVLGVEIACADCGCVVDSGVVVARCDAPDCCCAHLPVRRA